MSKYYIAWRSGGYRGYWCVFRKRWLLWDKKVFSASIYSYEGDGAYLATRKALEIYKEEEIDAQSS